VDERVLEFAACTRLAGAAIPRLGETFGEVGNLAGIGFIVPGSLPGIRRLAWLVGTPVQFAKPVASPCTQASLGMTPYEVEQAGAAFRGAILKEREPSDSLRRDAGQGARAGEFFAPP